VTGGTSFLVQTIWHSVGFLYIYRHLFFFFFFFFFFLVREVFTMILLKIFTGPLNWGSLLFSITIILWFLSFHCVLKFLDVLG
jgi:hypothetical protein